MNFQLTYKRFNEKAILIEWPSDINETILLDVLSFKKKIETVLGNHLIEVRSAYQSLLVVYKTYVYNETHTVFELKEIYNVDTSFETIQSKLWKVPVCYDSIFGLDLEDLSYSKNLSKEDIIRLHSESIYTVYFIGFLPGFLYLGGLDHLLFTPRKKTPRMQIEKGAVAIGGNQTGIYPNNSPGGWNVIGNSPIDFFDSKRERPCFAKAGDRIQFYSVSLTEYLKIKGSLEDGSYKIESEVWRD